MLLNFCHPCLRPEISCSTISTEGYDVKNLVNESSQGFLAYACIKPPINIDLTFICNVEISRVIVWPSVGSQKSSGFQLMAKSTTDTGVPYSTLSNAYLSAAQGGVIFYRRDINETLTCVPNGFLQRYIKISDHHAVNKATNLRLCIVKTENSVPAIGRIEVWGRVARCCGRDVIAGVNSLWTQEHSPRIPTIDEIRESPTKKDDHDSLEKSNCAVEIPEDFLDPITYEVMVQPIMLPSGKIIDQLTLERHEQNEALWGRSPSDPFTGIPFGNTCKPIIATSLKARIDKFLIENSNDDNIKKLPRTVGRKISQVCDQLVGVEKTVCANSKSTVLKVKSSHTLKRNIPSNLTNSQHKLPVLVMCTKQSLDLTESKRTRLSKTPQHCTVSDDIDIEGDCARNISNEIDGDLELNVKSVLSGLKRFNGPKTREASGVPKGCSCCKSSILYKLPCKHVICRRVLTTVKLPKCQHCGLSYSTRDPIRIHD
ncbi:RING finger protein 37 [Neodiprion fabricii]|uniref:RING finger protein 37 n=1 Tax=Neodiprion fabricii TaxID=2872261 RepID=UPI001ED90566|nr:RING finger protein 37 [Neodiprion fabricii]